MPIRNSTKGNRPAEPRKNFSCCAHNNGRWARMVNGKLYSFGVWDDPDAKVFAASKEK